MSKKLMMNNYSENEMLPIMDGLICWLDGRDGKIGDTVWKDRSGNGADVTLYNFKHNETSGWNNNGLLFDGTNNQCMSNPIGNFNYENLTYEINVESIDWEHNAIGDANTCGWLLCFANSNSYKWNGIRLANYSNQPAIKVFNFTNLYNVSSKIENYNQILEDKKIFTVVANKNEQSFFYDNGMKYGLGNLNKNNNYAINQFVLGCARLNRYPYGKFKINSIKIYNRALSEEEIQHNYLYEQSIERGE